MGSGCPQDIYMTTIAFKPWKVTSVTNVLPWKLNSNYTFSSASSNSVFDTPVNKGRGFAPYAIARVTDPTTSFCLKCKIKIENSDTNPLKIPFMAGIAVIDSNMNKIYEAGIGSLETPGVFDTAPKKRLLPVPLNSVTQISLSMYENKVTFFNGEKTIEQNITITSPTTLYVALFMRGRGYYKTIFTDVLCSGLTAMSSVPTRSPAPSNKYLQLSAAGTDAQIISTGNVSSVIECKNVCDITEQCTGFDIVTSTNFCTLRQMVQALPKNDVYTDENIPLPSNLQNIQTMSTSSINSINTFLTELRKAEASILKMKTATNNSWSIANDAYTNIQNVIQTLVNIRTNNERPSTSIWNSSFTALINLTTDAIQPVDYSVPFGSAAAGWVGRTFTSDFAGESAGLDAQSELDILIPVLINLNTNLEQTIFPLIDIQGQAQVITTIQTIQLPSPTAIINSVAFDSKGTLMIHSILDNSVIKIYKKNSNGEFFTTSILNLTAGSPVTFVLFDDQNNIICATSANGIQKFTRDEATETYPTTTSVQINATNNVTKMVMDESGKFMVTRTTTGTLQILVRQANDSYTQDSSLINNLQSNMHIPGGFSGVSGNTDITISKEGILCFNFVGSGNNSLLYNLKTNAYITSLYGLNLSYIYNLILVGDKNKTEILAYNRYESNKIFIHTLPNVNTDKYEITLPDEILRMSFDPTGIYLTVACTGGKIYVLRKQGNKKFIFTKSFNTTLELSYPIPPRPVKPIRGSLMTLSQYAVAMGQYAVAMGQWNENNRKVQVQFNPKTRDLIACLANNIKIFKKIASEEPTRFQSPSPRGTDTYLKVNNSILENLYIRINFSRSDTRGGGLKKVLNSFTPTLDISTLIIDCSSGRPDYLIIEDNFNNFYSGTFSYKAITYPSSTQTPVLAFAFSIENRTDFTMKTFYILTDTIGFKNYNIINDMGESVIDMPDNLGIAYDKIPSPVNDLTDIQKKSLFFSSSTEKWYRSKLIDDIMTFPINSNQNSISYNYTTKTLRISNPTMATIVSCDIEIKNHKITFKTNATTSTTSMSPSPVPETLIAVFFILDSTLTIMLTYVNQSFYNIFNISIDENGKPLKNVIYTKNNNIDTPYYYKLTEVYDPSNPYLEIDDKMVYALSQISGKFSPMYENIPIPNIPLLVYGKRFYHTSSNYIEFLDDVTLSVNGDRTFKYFSYNGIIIFIDKYGTVNTIIMKTTTVKYRTIRRYIFSEFFLDDKTIEYTLDQGTIQLRDNFDYSSSTHSQHRIKIEFDNSVIIHSRPMPPQAGRIETRYNLKASTFQYTNIVAGAINLKTITITTRGNRMIVYGINPIGFTLSDSTISSGQIDFDLTSQ